MFKNEYQGGNFFEIFNPSLKDPLVNCRVVGSHGIQKVYIVYVTRYILITSSLKLKKNVFFYF